MNIRIPLAALTLWLVPASLVAQIGVPARPLPDDPFVIETAEQGRVRVTVMKGLELPWDLAFLPGGDMLVTERTGRRLRIVRDGELDPEPIAGLPEIGGGAGGLMSVVAHPRFAETGWVYLSYTKDAAPGRRAVGLARGRLDGMRLTGVRELFGADEPGGGPPPGLPLVFGPDGFLYMGVGGADDEIAQRGDSYYGKVLRLNDDGSVPDNPFAGREGFKPEIYTIGHRNMIGMTIHPTTGEVWQNENGPLGGDEVNILKAGANYGWPLVSYGRDYSGEPVSTMRTMVGIEDPVLFWNPAIAISGMTFYTGDRFESWRNNLFVGGLQLGRIPRTGQMHRIVFNESWQEIRREPLFVELRQRIRDVEQGPDGLLYVLTDEPDGALLTLEPAEPADQAAARAGDVLVVDGEAPWAEDAAVQAVLAQRRAGLEAMISGTMSAETERYSSTFVANTPGNGVVPGNVLLELFGTGAIRYEHVEQHIEYAGSHGPDLVVIMGEEIVVPGEGMADAGQGIRRRFTDVFRRENGEWRHDLRHANVIEVE